MVLLLVPRPVITAVLQAACKLALTNGKRVLLYLDVGYALNATSDLSMSNPVNVTALPSCTGNSDILQSLGYMWILKAHAVSLQQHTTQFKVCVLLRA